MAMIYYAQRKSVKNGEPQTVNNRFGIRSEMERQYHLYCASASTNEAACEVDSIEWGTIEGGVIERKRWTWPQPEAEAEQGE